MSLLTTTAFAQEISYFVKTELPVIKGNSVERNHRDWIEVSGVYFQFANEVSAPSGGAGREAGVGKMSGVTFSVKNGTWSPEFSLATLTGERIGKLTIDYVKFSQDQGKVIQKVELMGVHFTNHSIKGLDEMVTVVADKITLTVYGVRADGTELPPVDRTWDFTAAKEL
jgi:type VI protein secretion system component Hcp